MPTNKSRPLKAAADARVTSADLASKQAISATAWPWADAPHFKNWFELNRECCDFVMHRMQQNTALVHQLATCVNPQDMLTVYQKFFEKAFADYQKEPGELVRISTIGQE